MQVRVRQFGCSYNTLCLIHMTFYMVEIRACLHSLFLQEGISQLESCKFIPLMYQLAARMSSKNLASDSFQEVLQEVRNRRYQLHLMCTVCSHHCVLGVCMYSEI